MDNLFKSFCESIEIQKETVKKIAMVKKQIIECIDCHYHTHLANEQSLYIGSYGRNTAVYIDNIRLLAIIPSNLYAQVSISIDDILFDMKRALNKDFVTCEFSDNGNGLNINIDGSLSFEIVPGFAFENGEFIYLLNKRWIQLNLKKEKELFKKLNDEVDNNLMNLCRMLKVWKFKQKIDISNILLDTFAYHFFNLKAQKTYDYNCYDEMLVDFFKFLLENCRSDNFISFDGKTILKRNEDIYDKVFFSQSKSESALASRECGSLETAIFDWKSIFGGFFLDLL